jgi:acyl-CoA dehydrogenase
MNEANELRGILADQVERLLSDMVEKKVQEAAEAGQWPAELWQAIEENGLTRVVVPEDLGGVGGSWGDAEVVIRAAGRHQAPAPLVEGIVAGWLLSAGNIPMPEGPISIAPVRTDDVLTLEGGKLSGRATRVPWGRNAEHFAVLATSGSGMQVALVAADAAAIEEDSNLAAEPRDTVTFDNAAVLESAPVQLAADSLQHIGAMVRSAQIAGALEFLLAESVQYANDRIQFGRAIGKFQAVQQELARLAGETAASGAAAVAAFRATDRGDGDFEIAVAKIRASEAATTATSIAHQAHGAIGFTYEHALHFATRRLWSWRSEFGSEKRWSEALGRTLAGRGADALWPFLTERSAGGD